MGEISASFEEIFAEVTAFCYKVKRNKMFDEH
jgi:hypothetical protein